MLGGVPEMETNCDNDIAEKKKKKRNCGNKVAKNEGEKKKMLRPQHFSLEITSD